MKTKGNSMSSLLHNLLSRSAFIAALLLLAVFLTLQTSRAAEADPENCEHSFQKVVIQYATCKQPMITETRCTKCGYVRGTETMQGDGHFRNPAIIETVASTCTTKGHRTVQCRYCMETRTDELPLAEHKYEWATVQQPTCTQPAIAEYRCMFCGYVLQRQEVPSDGHFFNPIIIEEVESTCTTNGYVTMQCRICKEIKTRLLSLAKHDYAWQTVSHPTATKPGSAEFRCTVCKAVKETKDLFLLSFDVCDGQGALPAAQEATSDDTVSIPKSSLTRDGYWFLGWATTKNAKAAQYKSGSSLTLTENTTLYAVWQPRTWTLSFDANGGDGKLPATVKATTGSTASIGKSAVTCAGCYFMGWSESPTATVATYKTGSPVVLTSDKVLYAVWKKKLVKLSFDANGGSGTLPTIKTVTYGNAASVGKCALTRDGFWFLGWATTADATTAQYKSGSELMLTEDTALYAVWKQK